MGIFNDITGVFNKGVEGAGRFADATSFKFRLGELERKRRNLAADLGESYRFLGDLLAGIRLICVGEDDSYVYSAQLSRSKRRMAAEP